MKSVKPWKPRAYPKRGRTLSGEAAAKAYQMTRLPRVRPLFGYALSLIVICLSVCLVVPLSRNVSGQEPATVPSDPAQFHLFVLAGQSNMAGRGKVTDEDQQIDPRVWMLDESRHWVPAVDPLHFDKPKVAGVGLGKKFAIDYANAHPGVQVGLIPCAVGGSAITTWQPGGFHDQTKSHPWDDCVARVNEATQAGVLKGFLWHQGESDSHQFESAKYEVRLTELIERFRQTFSAPDIPFLIGQLGRFDGLPWNEYRAQVDAAQQTVARTLPHCGFVSSKGLQHRGDRVHFDAESAREFGHRYYQVFAKMTDELR